MHISKIEEHILFHYKKSCMDLVQKNRLWQHNVDPFPSFEEIFLERIEASFIDKPKLRNELYLMISKMVFMDNSCATKKHANKKTESQ